MFQFWYQWVFSLRGELLRGVGRLQKVLQCFESFGSDVSHIKVRERGESAGNEFWDWPAVWYTDCFWWAVGLLCCTNIKKCESTLSQPCVAFLDYPNIFKLMTERLFDGLFMLQFFFFAVFHSILEELWTFNTSRTSSVAGRPSCDLWSASLLILMIFGSKLWSEHHIHSETRPHSCRLTHCRIRSALPLLCHRQNWTF